MTASNVIRKVIFPLKKIVSLHFIKSTKKSLTFLRFSPSNFVVLILLLLFSHTVLSQSKLENKNQIELLKKKSYSFLETAFWKSRLDSINKARVYAQAYLLKAKNDNNIKEIGDAFFMFSYSTSDIEETIKYADSTINITKNNINFHQPAQAYLLKANVFATRGNYKEAFTELDKANLCANSSGNTEQVNHIKYLIARLKTDIGDYESSIEILKELIKDYEDRNNVIGQITSLWAYGTNLNFLKKTDSAIKINKKAIILSLKKGNSNMYDRLLLSSAISNYDKEYYKSSLDSIYKLKKIIKGKMAINDNRNVLTNLYEGKIYLKQDKTKLAIKNFKKVDSISSTKKYFTQSVRENYELLVSYYKDLRDTKNQLIYINKLLKTDSILDSNHSYLVKNINSKYTTPNLLLEKQKIIESFKEENFIKKITLSILSLALVLLFFLLIRNTKKKAFYKNHIDNLVKKKKEQGFIIDDSTTNRILDDLKKIEQSDLFLDKDFNLSVLAKKLKTNTSYISKIINEHKQKTFKQYLIDYRIKTLIKNLEESPIIRKYSIEALAESIGYSNASSFTRIFKNHIGVSPSKYLKEKYFKN